MPDLPSLPLGDTSASLVHEHGAFFHAACDSCDWRGPGRRARQSVLRDAAQHQLLGHGGAPLGEEGVTSGRERLTARGRS